MSPIRRITALLANVLLLHMLWVGSAGACVMMSAAGAGAPVTAAGSAPAVMAHGSDGGDCAGAARIPFGSVPRPCPHSHMAGGCAATAQCAVASLQGAAGPAEAPLLRAAAPWVFVSPGHPAPDLRPTPPPPRV